MQFSFAQHSFLLSTSIGFMFTKLAVSSTTFVFSCSLNFLFILFLHWINWQSVPQLFLVVRLLLQFYSLIRTYFDFRVLFDFFFLLILIRMTLLYSIVWSTPGRLSLNRRPEVVLQVCGGGLVMDLDLFDSGDTERIWVAPL